MAQPRSVIALSPGSAYVGGITGNGQRASVAERQHCAPACNKVGVDMPDQKFDEVACPVCGRPMIVKHLIRRSFGENLHVLRCDPCGFATVEPVRASTAE